MDSGFIELFRQLPPGIPLMFCISAILLVVVFAFIVRGRQRRAVLAMAGAAPAMSVGMSTGDLPDLDSLATGEVMRARSGPQQVMLVGGEMVEVVEVLTILRDVGEGGLIIRIGEKAYRNPPKSSDADFNRRYQNALRDLTTPPATNLTPERETNARFQPPPPPRAPAPEPEPELESAPAPVVDEVTPRVAAEPVAAVDEAALPVDADSDDFDMPSEDDLAAPPPLPPLNLPPKMATGEIPSASFGGVPGDLPKFKMPDGPPVKPKRGQRPVAEPIPEINIAASIEAFLQHKLVQTPQFAGRSIHVRAAAHGGVHIEVDGTYYDSVGEVSDPGVRQYLTATIEEWQSRQ